MLAVTHPPPTQKDVPDHAWSWEPTMDDHYPLPCVVPSIKLEQEVDTSEAASGNDRPIRRSAFSSSSNISNNNDTMTRKSSRCGTGDSGRVAPLDNFKIKREQLEDAYQHDQQQNQQQSKNELVKKEKQEERFMIPRKTKTTPTRTPCYGEVVVEVEWRTTTNRKGSSNLRLDQVDQQEQHHRNEMGQQQQHVQVALPFSQDENHAVNEKKNQSVQEDDREALRKRLDEIVPRLPQEFKAQYEMICFAKHPTTELHAPARVMNPCNMLTEMKARQTLSKWVFVSYDELMKSHGCLLEMPRLVYFYGYHTYAQLSNRMIVPYTEAMTRGIHTLDGHAGRKLNKNMKRAFTEMEEELQNRAAATTPCAMNATLGLEGNRCPPFPHGVNSVNAHVGFTANVSQSDHRKHRSETSNRVAVMPSNVEPPSSSSCKKRKSREIMENELDDGDDVVNQPHMASRSSESLSARGDDDWDGKQPNVAKREEAVETQRQSFDPDTAHANKRPAFRLTEADKQLVLNSTIRDAKVEFDNKKRKVLAALPAAYKSRFGQMGFATVSTGSWSQSSWMPVLVMDPYDVPPGGVRHQWLTMFENLNELDRLDDLAILVYWYGTGTSADCYGFVSRNSFVSYSEGMRKDHDKVASDVGDDNNSRRIAKRRAALEEMREDARKDILERKRARHEFLEGYQLLSVGISF